MTQSHRFLVAALSCAWLAGCGGGLKDVLTKLDAPQREAANDLPEALPLNTDRSRALFLIIVRGLQDAGKPRAAIAYLRQYGTLYPNDPKAQLLLADCLLSAHEEKEAAALYKGLAGGEHEAASESGLGRVAASHAAWDEAASYFQQATMRDAANIAYLNDLGFAQIMTGHYDQALGTLRQANELAPDNGMIRNNLILALHLAGRDAEARSLVGQIARPDERAQGANLLSLDAAKLHVTVAKPQTLAAADIPVKPQGAR
jgi:tetratricopeptide (TPR) repeat protein